MQSGDKQLDMWSSSGNSTRGAFLQDKLDPNVEQWRNEKKLKYIQLNAHVRQMRFKKRNN